MISTRYTLSQQQADEAMRTVLEGGIASDVTVVRDADGREIVIKQALSRLKVAAVWHADPARSRVEVDALRVAGELLGAQAVPQVLWVDDEQNHRFAMERIDPALENWRAQLSRGCVDDETALQAGAALGQLHARSAQMPQLAERFAQRSFFEQLRIEPFFVRSAERNPQVNTAIERVIQTLRAPGSALVHGDYSPKNLLARGRRIVILDWEVAHWGDPRFDVAFCLAHLLLGGLRLSTATDRFREACVAFVEGYWVAGLANRDDSFVSGLTGCLLLARLDGDSPVDYLADLEVARVRARALQLIVAPPASVLSAIEQILA